MNVNQLRSAVNGENLSSFIVNLLLVAQPLTAKQIYYKLKKRHDTPVSYQAIHKQLKILFGEHILKKEALEYSVNSLWFEEAEKFTNNIKKSIKMRERIVKEIEKKERVFDKDQNKIKVISFDIGGALFDNHYDELLWRTEIPRKYAQQYKVSNEEAFERVTAEYRRLWGKVEGWRDPIFWLKHFSIDCSLEALTKNIQKHITPYHDVLPLIKKLSKKYHLIIITHSQHNIIDQKLLKANIKDRFLKIYSTVEDFSKMTKDTEIYREICEDLRVEPNEIIHIGNKYDFDYIVPSEIGMRAFLIDRVGDRKENFVIRDLYELEEKIREAESDF